MPRHANEILQGVTPSPCIAAYKRPCLADEKTTAACNYIQHLSYWYVEWGAPFGLEADALPIALDTGVIIQQYV